MTINLNDLPEVSFVEKDINKIIDDMVTGYEEAYFNSTGDRKKLYPGDPIRIFLYSQALREFQLRVLVDDSAKQNLLKYARKNHLDNLGAFSKTSRLNSSSAKVKVKFTLSQAQANDLIIPANTRVSPDYQIYFYVKQDTLVSAGTQNLIMDMECTVGGNIGNGFLPGQINILVDPLPWVSSIENTEISQGGTDVENDDSYRNRIYLAPEGFSVAGPSGAYEYFARKYSHLVSDVKITSPSDGVVDIRILLTDGEIPGVSFIEGISEYLSAKERRPLTDKVQVSAPDTVNYDIELTYYISNEDVSQEALIKSKVNQVIEGYKMWQKNKIGRDINPSELITKIRLAGAKRASIVKPVYTVVDDKSISIINLETVTYGGLEDE